MIFVICFIKRMVFVVCFIRRMVSCSGVELVNANAREPISHLRFYSSTAEYCDFEVHINDPWSEGSVSY